MPLAHSHRAAGLGMKSANELELAIKQQQGRACGP